MARAKKTVRKVARPRAAKHAPMKKPAARRAAAPAVRPPTSTVALALSSTAISREVVETLGPAPSGSTEFRGALPKNLARWSPDLVAVERWTLDRFDETANVVRLEKVAMRGDVLLAAVRAPGDDGPVFQGDNIRWWNSPSATTLAVPAPALREMLSLRQAEPLRENMVFFVGYGKQPAKITKVYHASTEARALSKQLYAEVLRAELGLEEGGES